MRIGRVVGTVCLNRSYDALVGGRFVILEVQDRFVLSGQPRKTSEYIVCYDHLGAGQGELVAFSESREACMPFYPEKRMPIDAYCSAILDNVTIDNNAMKGLVRDS